MTQQITWSVAEEMGLLSMRPSEALAKYEEVIAATETENDGVRLEVIAGMLEEFPSLRGKVAKYLVTLHFEDVKPYLADGCA